MNNNLQFGEEISIEMNTKLCSNHYKLRRACRNQFEFSSQTLDDLIPQDHKARLILEFVEQMDLSVCLEGLSSFGTVGRPATDPYVILTLWIYTILDGNASARKLEELCKYHIVYRWICGGISMNRTSLAEFQSKNPKKFEQLLTSCLAIMVKHELISDTDFAQDGTRVKANAGAGSFRRESSLVKLETEIEEYIQNLRKIAATLNGYEKRKIAQQTRYACEKKERILAAIRTLHEARCQKEINQKRNNKKVTENKLENIRASTTDPEVRKMKMGDGGFRLAYNVQFATGLDSRVIYGVDVVNTLDPGTAPRLMAQVQERLRKLSLNEIKNWIGDAAYSAKRDIIAIAGLFPNCTYYAPPNIDETESKKHRKGDCVGIKKWRDMIGSEKIKGLYKKRCSTAEFSNMQVKNKALDEISVRGLVKAKGVAFLHAISMNINRAFNLFKKKLLSCLL